MPRYLIEFDALTVVVVEAPTLRSAVTQAEDLKPRPGERVTVAAEALTVESHGSLDDFLRPLGVR